MSMKFSNPVRRSLLAAAVGGALVGCSQPGGGAALRKVQDKLGEFVTPRDFGAVGDGVADDAAALAAAFAARALPAVDARHSSGVLLVNGCGLAYAIDSHIQIPSNLQFTNGTIICRNGATVRLGGSAEDLHYYSGLTNARVMGGDVAGDNPASVNLIAADYLFRGDLRDCVSVGSLGAGIRLGGNCRNMALGQTYAYRACQNVAAITGAIEIRGSDHTVEGDLIGQATVSADEIAEEIAAPGSTQIQYRVGVLINASTMSVGGCIRGEVSGFAGIHIQSSYTNALGNLFADQNAGHGVYFASNCSDFSATVRSSDNNRLNGAYDALVIAAGTVSRYDITSVTVDELGAIGHPMRYHVAVLGSSAMADRGQIAYPRGRLSGAARLSLVQVSPAIVEGRHRFGQFVNGDTTPSVEAGTCFTFANDAPVTVTTFDDGYEGKEITILGDGNTTLQHPNIVCPLGRSYKPRINDVVRLVKRSGDWYVVSAPRVTSTAQTIEPPPISHAASWSVDINAPGAEVGDVATVTLGTSTQGLLVCANVTAADTVKVTLGNLTGAIVDLPANSARVFVTKI